MRFQLIEPPSDNALTGGYLYNHRVVLELARPDGATRCAVARHEIDDALLRRKGPCIVDSLYLSEVSPRALEGDPPVLLLVHYMADDAGGAVDPRVSAALRAARGVIVTSGFMSARVRARAPGVRVRVCRPGVDPFALAIPSERDTGLCQILTVANFERRKGHLDLQEALREVCDLEWHWHVIGDVAVDREYAAEFGREAVRLGMAGRTTVHGPLSVELVREHFESADLFALLTTYEPYGMVFAESVASGTPVVAYDVGGVGESVRDGHTGFLVKPGARADAARCIRDLLESPLLRARMRQACVDDAPRFSTWGAAAECFARSADDLARF